MIKMVKNGMAVNKVLREIPIQIRVYNAILLRNEPN